MTSAAATDRLLVAARQLVDGVYTDPDAASTATSAVSVDRALAAAWRTHRSSPHGIGAPEQRSAVLRAAADRLEACAPDIAAQDTADTGVPISVTRLFAGSLAATLRSAADRVADLAPTSLDTEGRRVTLHRLPLGPAVVLAPWNAPTAVAAKKAAFAWAAGCPVIIKPSPWSPHGTALLVDAMADAARDAGLPRACVQLVLGGADVGQQLVSSPLVRAVSFTGSRRGGRAVAAAAAAEVASTQLELGSNNPAIVLPDADVPGTARALAAGMTKLNGAWCESPGTVFVPVRLRDELIGALLDEFGRLIIGDPFDDATTFGPQAFAAHADALRERLGELARSGARVVSGGVLPPGRTWLPPTLVIDPPPELARTEMFGPVLFVRTATADDAIAASFDLETGLAGYVFGTDIEPALQLGALLPVGEVKVNGTSVLDMSSRSTQAFWYGSGVGGHGDHELLRFFTGARIVGEDVDSPL